MGKYDAPLDYINENSLSLILNHIEKGSSVLEFGPANGRMTRYMKNILECSIDIVEIDEESGKQATSYADIACLGNPKGDVEKYLWTKELANKQYDYITLVDVLEHLYNPNLVLKTCKKFLKPDGKILVSIPNIANNSIIVSLLNNMFTYTDVGLLDNTHIRFFTYNSFLEMIRKIGYQAITAEATLTRIGNNEVAVNKGMVSKGIQRELAIRDKGNVYQYIFQLVEASENTLQPLSVNIADFGEYKCECFIGHDGIISENSKVMKFINCAINSEYDIIFDLSKFKIIDRIRIDPLNVNTVLQLKTVELLFDDGECKCFTRLRSNGFCHEDIYFFSTDDPQFYIDDEVGSQKKKVQSIRIQFKILAFQDEIIDNLASFFKSTITELNAQHNELIEMDKKINELKNLKEG